MSEPDFTCTIYLIPLKRHPVFKLGNSKDLNARMRNMGIYRHADKKSIVAVQLPDKKSAEILEKSIGRILRPFSTAENIPQDIVNGRTEFFTADAWDNAVELVSNLRKSGWDCKIVKWSRNIPQRPAKIVKPLSKTTLDRRFRQKREIRRQERYNSLIASNYWVRALRDIQGYLVDLRDSPVHELEGEVNRLMDSKADFLKSGDLWPAVAYANIARTIKNADGKWLLVYKGDEDGDVFKAIETVIDTGPVFSSHLRVFSGACSCDEYAIIEINQALFSCRGAEKLLDYFRSLAPKFPGEGFGEVRDPGFPI